ncbi:MAG: FHA domain-containing protein [Anaerolineales bacterium]|nr:FHA domain-containing protein [Anaerolineales bacterium]
MRKFSALLLSLSLLLGAAPAAHAQQNLASAELYPADVTSFPTISAFLDVFDSNGIFASGLKPEAVSVIEDGQPLPVDSLNEIAVPLQLVVAVNQGEPLDVRDPTNFSRFQRVSQVLAQWAQSRPADLPDDYSLVSQAGPVINHASAADFVVGLNGFQPDFRAAVPNLQSLSIAIDTVSAQTTRLGMKRAILFITPHTEDGNIVSALEPYIQRALENNIYVFVWLVDSQTTFSATSAAAFNNLALQTGGSMFTYSGLERFPDPEAYFSGLRRVFTLSYTSRLKTAGEHTLSVNVNLASGAVASADQKLSVDIQPPNAFPLTTSLQITRRAPEDDPFNTEILLPATQEIEIITEFPDGHVRPLTRTTLYVDGAIMDENTVEPFNLFTWDLSKYTSSGEHQIMVEVVDSLGLSKSSMAVPVVVTVIQPPNGISALLAKYRTPITFGAIILAGLVLFMILLSGRLRIPSIRAAQEARRADADPLRQSVQTATESATTPLAATSASKTQRRATLSKKAAADTRSRKDAAASLIRINAEGQVLPVTPIALIEQEIIFGTDPAQCTQIMDDPSISPVHTRLRQTEDGGFLLLDNGSIAGTWVNYEPIPREGYRLAHGDMVNFGQLIYRFTLRVPPVTSKPKITVQHTEE